MMYYITTLSLQNICIFIWLYFCFFYFLHLFYLICSQQGITPHMNSYGAVGDIFVFSFVTLSDNTVYTENRKYISSSSYSSNSSNLFFPLSSAYIIIFIAFWQLLPMHHLQNTVPWGSNMDDHSSVVWQSYCYSIQLIALNTIG